jgi:hypothetical protein
MTPSDQNPPLRDLVVRRQLAAPVSAVWRAFTEDAEVMKWWGPEQFTAPVARMDVRVGGRHVVTFESQANGTRTELVVTERGYGPGPFDDLSKTGLEQCLDKLERALAVRQ